VQCKVRKWGSFHELKVSQTFSKHATPDFADKPLFVSFQQNKLVISFSNTVYEMLCIPHFNWKHRRLIGQNKVKVCKLWSQNFKYLGQKIVCPRDDIHNFYLAQLSWRTCLSGLYIYQPELWNVFFSTYFRSQIGEIQWTFGGAANDKCTRTTNKSRWTILWTKKRTQV